MKVSCTLLKIILSTLLLWTNAAKGSLQLRRGREDTWLTRLLVENEPGCVISGEHAHGGNDDVSCSAAGGPKPYCTPFRSPEYCGDTSFPTLIAKRTRFINNHKTELQNDGWWFQHLNDKIINYVFAATGGYNPAKIQFCSANGGAGLDNFAQQLVDQQNSSGFVIRATDLHSNRGIYVLPTGFGGLEVIRNVVMSMNDVKVDLGLLGASKFIVEEYLPGPNNLPLPVEYKFHMFGGEVGSINIVYGRGTGCGCWAEMDVNRTRLDQYGCFTKGVGPQQKSGECTSIDFNEGSKKPFPVKGLDLCDSLPDLDPCIMQEMLAMAVNISKDVGVYVRVDMFVAANGRVYLQEVTTNHLNGLRHCAARLDANGCIDPCFQGEMWKEMGHAEGANVTLGGSMMDLPPQLSAFLDLEDEQQCEEVFKVQLVPSTTGSCSPPTSTPAVPSIAPIVVSSSEPSSESGVPIAEPTVSPDDGPSSVLNVTDGPSSIPSSVPSSIPSSGPSPIPSSGPSSGPSIAPPSGVPTFLHSEDPSAARQTDGPSLVPSDWFVKPATSIGSSPPSILPTDTDGIPPCPPSITVNQQCGIHLGACGDVICCEGTDICTNTAPCACFNGAIGCYRVDFDGICPNPTDCPAERPPDGQSCSLQEDFSCGYDRVFCSYADGIAPIDTTSCSCNEYRFSCVAFGDLLCTFLGGVPTVPQSEAPSTASQSVAPSLGPSDGPSFKPTVIGSSFPSTLPTEDGALPRCPPSFFGGDSCVIDDESFNTCGDIICCHGNDLICTNTAPCACSDGTTGCTTVDLAPEFGCPNPRDCPAEKPPDGQICSLQEDFLCGYKPVECAAVGRSFDTTFCQCTETGFLCAIFDFCAEASGETFSPSAASSSAPTELQLCPLALPSTGDSCITPEDQVCAYEDFCCNCEAGVFSCAERGGAVTCPIAECPAEVPEELTQNCTIVKDFDGCGYLEVCDGPSCSNSTNCACRDGRFSCFVQCPSDAPLAGDICTIPEGHTCKFGVFCCPNQPDRCFKLSSCTCDGGRHRCTEDNKPQDFCRDAAPCPPGEPSTGDSCNVDSKCSYGRFYCEPTDLGVADFVPFSETDCTCVNDSFVCLPVDQELFCEKESNGVTCDFPSKPCQTGFECIETPIGGGFCRPEVPGGSGDICNPLFRPCSSGLTCIGSRCVPLDCVTDAFTQVVGDIEFEGILDSIIDNSGIIANDTGISFDQEDVCGFLKILSSTSPLLFLGQFSTNIETCSDAPFSTYYGISIDGGNGIKGTASLSYAFDLQDREACYATLCGGAGAVAALSFNLVVGVVMTEDVAGIEGSTAGVDFDGGIGGVAVQASVPGGVPLIEFALAAGAGVNAGSGNICTAILVDDFLP